MNAATATTMKPISRATARLAMKDILIRAPRKFAELPDGSIAGWQKVKAQLQEGRTLLQSCNAAMRQTAMSRLVVAIDGPSGAGKGTVARAVAAELGYRHVDSGAMYR